jgi:Beta-galactosidase
MSSSPELGVCYYPEHWPQDLWISDAENMVKTGIKWVRIAEFAWSHIEKSPNNFDFEWLDNIVDILGKARLKIVMCTPTATPPKWLVDQMPDMVAVDSNGQPRKFGFPSALFIFSFRYLEQSKRITEIIAQRYGDNPYVQAWQTDNEYGCHERTYFLVSSSLREV